VGCFPDEYKDDDEDDEDDVDDDDDEHGGVGEEIVTPNAPA